MTISTIEEVEVNLSWKSKSTSALKKESNTTLQGICKSYGRPYSGKKDDLVRQIHKGPADEGITEQERMLKYTLMAPLPDKDRAAHKLGSLNEDNVRSVIDNLIHDEYDDYIYSDSWETGFFLNKKYKWFGASLDGWLINAAIFPGRSTLIQNPNYNKSRKRTSDTDTAAISSDAEDVDPGTCSRVENNKKRKTIFQGSRCVVCTKIVGAESAAKVMTRCPTCNVFLCAIPRGRNKHSCWVKWHSIAHLDQLVKVRTVTPPTRSSPRRNVRSSPRITKRSRRMSSADC